MRFMILCDSLELPAWQANCLRQVIDYGVAELVGVVVRIPAPEVPLKMKWRSRWENRGLLLWRLFNRLYVDKAAQSIVPTDIRQILGDTLILHEEPAQVGKYHQALTPRAIEIIKALRPDFILRFGFGMLKGEILTCAKYGVWSYHHGDPAEFRGQPPGFWEMLHGSPVVGAVLQILSEELDGGAVLHKGCFQVTPHSYAKTRDTLYFGSASWVRRMCASIHENGWRAPLSTGLVKKGEIFKEPRNGDMFRHLCVTVIRFLRSQITYKLYRQNWNCAVVHAPVPVVAGLLGAQKQADALRRAHWMPVSRGAFRADPFGYIVNDRKDLRILFELFHFSRGLGSIAAVEYKAETFGPSEIILEEPTHLSYPYVFLWDNAVHYIPEHSAARNISAFQLDSRGRTVRKTIIFPRSELIDATFLNWNEKYWVFALDESNSKNTDLHIYFAERLEGPWRAHPLNPVKSDITSARPGGTPFIREGKLYRPAQDCSTHYGRATVINEVIVLTEKDFVEQPVSSVQPLAGGGYEYGLHTISAVGDITLIDGAKKESVLSFGLRGR